MADRPSEEWKITPATFVGPLREGTTEALAALRKKGASEKISLPAAWTYQEMQDKGHQPVIKNAGRSVEESLQNYIRGTSRTMHGSRHLVGGAVDMRDRRFPLENKTERGKSYIKDLHKISSTYGMHPADSKNPLWDPHHRELRNKEDKAGARRKVLDFLETKGVTSEDMARLRTTVMGLPKKKREAAAKKQLRDLLNAAGDPSRKAAVQAQSSLYAPSDRPAPVRAPGYDEAKKPSAINISAGEPEFNARWDESMKKALSSAFVTPQQAAALAAETSASGPRLPQTEIGGDKVQVA